MSWPEYEAIRLQSQEKFENLLSSLRKRGSGRAFLRLNGNQIPAFFNTP
jgi:hypothetical protein